MIKLNISRQDVTFYIMAEHCTASLKLKVDSSAASDFLADDSLVGRFTPSIPFRVSAFPTISMQAGVLSRADEGDTNLDEDIFEILRSHRG